MGNYMVENSWKPEKMNVLNVRKSMFSWPKNMRRMCDSTLISSRFHLEKGCSRWQLWGNLAFLGGGGGNQPQVEIYLGLVCRQTAADGEKLRETITILAIKQTWVWKPLECERETVCFNVVTWKISWCGRWTNNKMEGGTKFDGMGWADRSTTSPFFQKKTNLIGGGLFFGNSQKISGRVVKKVMFSNCFGVFLVLGAVFKEELFGGLIVLKYLDKLFTLGSSQIFGLSRQPEVRGGSAALCELGCKNQNWTTDKKWPVEHFG